jgi:hypothetical protein
MMAFKAAKNQLRYLGVEFRQKSEWRGEVGKGRKEVKLPIFESVLLPLTHKEWCFLVQKNGPYYVGGCCTQMSVLQDELAHLFRFDSGWVSCGKLAEIADIMIGHDCSESDDPKMLSFKDYPGDLNDLLVKAKRNWRKISVWNKIQLVWHLVKDNYTPEVPDSFDHWPPIRQSLHTLANGFSALNWEHLIERMSASDQFKAQHTILLARILPALKTFNDNLDKLGLEPVEGFALIDKEAGPDAVAENGKGYCLFETREEAEDMLRAWRRDEAEHEDRKPEKPIDDRIGIRPMRVTVEKGLELL